jgi:ElaB/YqjD/DUF883 family membrane-anchored ribosome-binding protein
MRDRLTKARGAVNEEVMKLMSDVEELIKRVEDVDTNGAKSQLARLYANGQGAVRATKEAIAERAEATKEAIVDRAEATKEAIIERAEEVRRRAQEALEAGNEYVHERPWRVVGAAAVAGLALGLTASAMARRRG